MKLQRPRPEVVIVESDMHLLMEHVVAFRGMSYEITAAESRRPVRAACRLVRGTPAAMIVELSGAENVVDIRTLLSFAGDVPVLLLTHDMPPSAAVARIVRSHGGEIMGLDQAPIVLVATLVALLAAGRRQPA
jgi:hypothetical protein